MRTLTVGQRPGQGAGRAQLPLHPMAVGTGRRWERRMELGYGSCEGRVCITELSEHCRCHPHHRALIPTEEQRPLCAGRL